MFRVVVAKHKRVVILVSQYQEEKTGSVIDEIEALLNQHNDDKALSIEIVASGCLCKEPGSTDCEGRIGKSDEINTNYTLCRSAGRQANC